MARVTVEDCLRYVENRFDLVLKASARAHLLERGEAEPKVPEDNDKPTVIALREIAQNLLGPEVGLADKILEEVVTEQQAESEQDKESAESTSESAEEKAEL